MWYQVAHIFQTSLANTLNFIPDRTTSTGAMIDKYLRNEIDLNPHSAHLLFAANRHEVKLTIIDYLNSGKTVVMDRYSFSGITYASANGVIVFLFSYSLIG